MGISSIEACLLRLARFLGRSTGPIIGRVLEQLECISDCVTPDVIECPDSDKSGGVGGMNSNTDADGSGVSGRSIVGKLEFDAAKERGG